MGANVLDSHTKVKKHCDIAKDRLAGLHCSFFRKKKPAVSIAEKSVKKYVRTAKL